MCDLIEAKYACGCASYMCRKVPCHDDKCKVEWIVREKTPGSCAYCTQQDKEFWIYYRNKKKNQFKRVLGIKGEKSGE